MVGNQYYGTLFFPSGTLSLRDNNDSGTFLLRTVVQFVGRRHKYFRFVPQILTGV
jgi:hypothetical protein